MNKEIEFENFLDKWYNLKRENTVLENNYLKLNINLFPGNLEKILNKIRNIGKGLKSDRFVKNFFYSYKKDIYFQTSFVYFEYVSYIVNRINSELDNLFCTGTSFYGSKDDYKDIREVFRRKQNKKGNSILFEFENFWINGNIDLRIFNLNKEEITESDKLYIDQIVNDAHILLLEKVEKIIIGEEPILTETLYVKDKESKIEDCSFHLNFYTNKVELIINNFETKENIQENIQEKINKNYILNFDYQKSIKEGSSELNYCVNQIKEFVFKKIINKLKESDIFKLESEKKDLNINSVENEHNGWSMKGFKYIINKGTLSIEDFKKIAEELSNDEEYYILLIKAILN
jgi:hypothetical protein